MTSQLRGSRTRIKLSPYKPQACRAVADAKSMDPTYLVKIMLVDVLLSMRCEPMQVAIFFCDCRVAYLTYSSYWSLVLLPRKSTTSGGPQALQPKPRSRCHRGSRGRAGRSTGQLKRAFAFVFFSAAPKVKIEEFYVWHEVCL